jgi:hypothetical protein
MLDATALWKNITGEMMLAKKAGMTPRELAMFTDKRAVEILVAALDAVRNETWEAAAKVLDASMMIGSPMAMRQQVIAYYRAQAKRTP